MNRRIIPDNKTIVILDTSPVRRLAHEVLPEWVDVFVDMSKGGYSFSLADSTAAELLIQFRSGRIPREDYYKMLMHLERFLNPKMPVMPGKIDLELMIGISHPNYDINSTEHLSQYSWEILNNPELTDNCLGPSLEEIQNNERLEWVRSLEHLANMSLSSGIDISKMKPEHAAEFFAILVENNLNSEYNIVPPMGIRMHLELRHRFRQMARTTLKKKAYNPSSKSKINDGIDVDLFKYFILPAFVVAEDNGFFGSLEGIDSFQKDWFIKPQELSQIWKSGHHPKPMWPTTNG